MVDEHEYERWLGEALRALRSADLQGEADLHNWACFACEQAAQLALKAPARSPDAHATGMPGEHCGDDVPKLVATRRA